MGCNTSQELKTKESETSANGDNDGAMMANTEPSNNCGTIMQKVGLSSSELKNERKSPLSAAKQHSKVDSLLSNGDTVKYSLEECLNASHNGNHDVCSEEGKLSYRKH